MKDICGKTAIWKNKVRGLSTGPPKQEEIHEPLINFYPGFEKLLVRPRNRRYIGIAASIVYGMMAGREALPRQ